MSSPRHPKRVWFLGFVVPSLCFAVALYTTADCSPLFAWLVAANAVALCIWGFDKWSASRGGRRVPESTLHWMAFLGAAPACLAGMALFRHKIRKWYFPALALLWLVVWAASFYWYQRR